MLVEPAFLRQLAVDYFRGDLITLSSPGIATLAFISNVAKVLHMLLDDTDDTDVAIDGSYEDFQRVIEVNGENYHTHNKGICSKFQNDILSDLSKLSKILHDSLKGLMIGNMIKAIIKNLATPLQRTVAISLRD